MSRVIFLSKRLTAVNVTALITAIILIIRIVLIDNDTKVLKAASGRGRYTLSDKCEYASIYDRNGQRLNNRNVEYFAVLDPHNADSLNAAEYACDPNAFHSGMSGTLPFFCKVTSENIPNVIVFRKYIRTESDQPARHVIGYTSDGKGVCGIELSYDDFLRENYTENRAVFSVDALGSVLEGLVSEKTIPKEMKCGVVTTLDIDIQTIAEKVFRQSGYKKGAVVIMDVKSGDILACASFPEFDTQELAASLENEDSPFVNRAFSAYSVGSIFKLVTASAALESGISEDFSYTCSGSIDIDGQIFNCHKWGGHGEISMEDAMVSSCNPYFIALSETLSPKLLHDTAERLGFGEKSVFADGLYSQSGYLPTERDLSVRAEKGNFSFGQGKLTATPIQICRLTCAIANNGMMPQARLIDGIRDANGSKTVVNSSESERVLYCLTAQKLKRYMIGVVNAPNSCSYSNLVSCAGKTSTAQTGQFGANGKENLNCWFTGFFPTSSPKYAVTILVEGGVSGNVSCGPIFKEITEEICNIKSRQN